MMLDRDFFRPELGKDGTSKLLFLLGLELGKDVASKLLFLFEEVILQASYIAIYPIAIYCMGHTASVLY